MADAFVYMFFVGSGTASGVAVVGFMTWRIVVRVLNKGSKKVRKRPIV